MLGKHGHLLPVTIGSDACASGCERVEHLAAGSADGPAGDRWFEGDEGGDGSHMAGLVGRGTQAEAGHPLPRRSERTQTISSPASKRPGTSTTVLSPTETGGTSPIFS